MRTLKQALPNFVVFSNIETTKILQRWPLTKYIEARREIWTLNGETTTPIECAYNEKGDYVGDLAFAKFLAGRCIRPEKSSPDHNVCSIGFCAPKNSWWGWSHRASCEFMIGDRIFEENYGDEHTLFRLHGSKTINTMDDARQAAVNFANYIG